MTHALSLLLEFILFAIDEFGGIEFVVLILHKVGLASVGLNLLLHTFQFALPVFHQGVCFAVVGQFLVRVGDNIHHTELEVLAPEKQVLVLAMHVDKALAQFL